MGLTTVQRDCAACDLCKRNQQPSSERSGTGTDDADDIDPKLKEAILKSRKLDRILQRKFQREKNVKRERLQLHHRSVLQFLYHGRISDV